MTKYDQMIENWASRPPHEERKTRVFAVLNQYLPGKWKYGGKGSHIVVTDKRLKGLGYPYGPAGDFTIPIWKGQKVKGYYLKTLARTIKLLKEMESDQE